jgi:hypothetical protein
MHSEMLGPAMATMPGRQARLGLNKKSVCRRNQNDGQLEANTSEIVFLKTSAVWFDRSSFDTIEIPLASSRYAAPSGAGMSIDYWKSSPIQPTAGYRR